MKLEISWCGVLWIQKELLLFSVFTRVSINSAAHTNDPLYQGRTVTTFLWRGGEEPGLKHEFWQMKMQIFTTAFDILPTEDLTSPASKQFLE